MSASKRIAIAVTISWVSRAISILSGLLLMPILFRFIEKLGLKPRPFRTAFML
jgi:hypothetical protein